MIEPQEFKRELLRLIRADKDVREAVIQMLRDSPVDVQQLVREATRRESQSPRRG